MKEEGLHKNIKISTQAGAIPLFDKGFPTQRSNIYLIGDAAGQVKATTGGGIVPALRASKVLRDCIANGRNYDREWKRTVGKELSMHARIRKILDKMSEKDYTDTFKKIRNAKIGDSSRDNVVPMLLKLLLKKPSLIKLVKYLF
jgi:flavin-dependent dehydrogenase